jgi:hypothetical protein
VNCALPALGRTVMTALSLVGAATGAMAQVTLQKWARCLLKRRSPDVPEGMEASEYDLLLTLTAYNHCSDQDMGSAQQGHQTIRAIRSRQPLAVSGS